ncbi:MAG: Soluble lytic murein transglycosylase and related regulatory protein [Herbinix sp.]|jgi:soluble lytic murein transglycosylase-like protein|nr:Soluble lytic murein transglycosylase and related regulatory protein [Herbinix sp.]
MRKIVILFLVSLVLTAPVKVKAFEEPVAGITKSLENYHYEKKENVFYEQSIAGISPAMENYYNNYEEPAAYEESIAGISVSLDAYEKDRRHRKYDIPLSSELQRYVYDVCKEYDNVRPKLVFSVLDKESDFDFDAVGYNDNGTKDVGGMQINSSNHKWLTKKLGVTDFFDPKQNILSGVYMLSLFGGMKDLHQTLVSYNAGPDNWKEYVSEGIYSTKYSRDVLRIMDEIENKKINERGIMPW